MNRSHRQPGSDNRVDFCVTTMDRPAALERLLFSIAAQHPQASIYVADQSKSFDRRGHERLAFELTEAGLHATPVVHRLPFDCGVSAARNHLVHTTPSEYKLLLDDDFAFTDQTDIAALERLLDAYPEAGVVGGGVTREGRLRHAGSQLRRRDDVLDQLEPAGPVQERAGVRFQQVDFLPMFTMMRRQLFTHVQWDPALKTAGEELDFFLRVQPTPFVVLYAPDVTVDHPRVKTSASYRDRRMRLDFLKRILVKHGLRRMTSITGATAELCADGQLAWRTEAAAKAR